MSLLLLTASCGYLGSGDPSFGDTDGVTFAADETIYLTCTANCEAQAQCGRNASTNDILVFANAAGVTTRNHSHFMPHNTAVKVLGAQSHQLVREVDGGQVRQLNFYQIETTVDDVPAALWLSGWCVSDQTVAR